MSNVSTTGAPPKILIVGAGIFGLSTALELLTRPKYVNTNITIIDHRTPNPTEPNSQIVEPCTSSLDSSSIIHTDYADFDYAELAVAAHELWREGWGGEGNYHESGVVHMNSGDGKDAVAYVENSLNSIQALEKQQSTDNIEQGIQEQLNQAVIKAALPTFNFSSGNHSYVDKESGWVNTAGAIQHIRQRIVQISTERQQAGLGTVEWITAPANPLFGSEGVGGVGISPIAARYAAVTIVCMGAWTTSHLDIPQHLTTTGNAVAYIQLTPEETKRLRGMPVFSSASERMTLTPPTPNGILKITQHGRGYRNPVRRLKPETSRFLMWGEEPSERHYTTISIPTKRPEPIPLEAEAACRAFLATILPTPIAMRPFSSTRIVWYADTLTGDFLVDHHPKYKRLFVATGGSGHVFKFFPVLGKVIVDSIERKKEDKGNLRKMWKFGTGRDRLWETVSGDGVWDTEGVDRSGKRGWC